MEQLELVASYHIQNHAQGHCWWNLDINLNQSQHYTKDQLYAYQESVGPYYVPQSSENHELKSLPLVQSTSEEFQYQSDLPQDC